MQTLRHVVVGTDFSECSELALAISISVAAGAHARLTLVHVCVDDVSDEQLVTCGETLSALLARYRARHVETASVLRYGRPSEKLENVATEVGAGLIVVGRRGAHLGSVAALLVRTASRPVLIVPSSHVVTKGISS
jgi:nucleotide-binding universal stress UspA family protein